MAHNRLTLDDIDPEGLASGRWRVGAAPGDPGGMVLPVSLVFVHHTDSRATADVAADVAAICDYDQHQFGKVSYSFLLHAPTNTVVEVEGLHRGAHTIDNDGRSLNYVSFGLGVVGNFQSDAEPQPADTVTAEHERLILECVHDELWAPGHLADGFVIEGHRDAPYATACPGDRLYGHLDTIRRLARWAPDDRPTIPPTRRRKNMIVVELEGGGQALLTDSGFHPIHATQTVTNLLRALGQDEPAHLDAATVQELGGG